MKNNSLVLILSLFSLSFYNCDSGKSSMEENNSEIEASTKKEVVSFYGTYTLTDMVPITGDKKLTDQDTKYITDSKERTIGNTKLTINEDGTFNRVFPHPSGDGTTKAWKGTYTLSNDESKIILKVDFNGNIKEIEFDVLKKDGKTLSISSSFGQIEMNYVYTK